MNTTRKCIILAGGTESRLWRLRGLGDQAVAADLRQGLERLVAPIADSGYGAYLHRVLTSPA